MSDSATLLVIAQELDRMERDVTSWEADFLDSVLQRLENGGRLSEKQAITLHQMHEKYLGDGVGDDQEIEDDWLG